MLVDTNNFLVNTACFAYVNNNRLLNLNSTELQQLLYAC